MSKPKVYIDGQSGTTGLQIKERLSDRDDLELIVIDDNDRHNDEVRKAAMKEADLVFLCLPEGAAIEAVELCDPSTKIIDASTAHRTKWTYGFPELDAKHKEDIQSAMKVANPGCHATGFISLIAPLRKARYLSSDVNISCTSLTGYSGGGKKMIADYEGNPTQAMASPGAYGLGLSHKHLPEIMDQCDLKNPPVFIPVVDDFRQGMLTLIGLNDCQFEKPVSKEELVRFYTDWYKDSPLITVESCDGISTLYANEKAQTDGLVIRIGGNDEQILLAASFDNLGKGACGAAIENMNYMLGLDPLKGLVL